MLRSEISFISTLCPFLSQEKMSHLFNVVWVLLSQCCKHSFGIALGIEDTWHNPSNWGKCATSSLPDSIALVGTFTNMTQQKDIMVDMMPRWLLPWLLGSLPSL